MPAKLFSEVTPDTWPEGRGPTWKLGLDGYESPFGQTEHRVIFNKGKPRFDRVVIVEPPHVIIVAVGRGYGQPLLGLVKETRDTAAPLDGVTSSTFWGPPRGFLQVNETIEAAIARLVNNETGKTLIQSVQKMGQWITNETTTSSWSDVVIVDVDLKTHSKIRTDRNEPFYKVDWFTRPEVAKMIFHGTHEDASTRSMVMTTVAFLFSQIAIF